MSLSRSLVFAVPLALLALAGCGSPRVKCLPSNCSGCCDADGECVVTPSELACGLRGASCVACFPGQACMSGFCTTTNFGGGTGGGEVGGGGGETGGGGGTMGGGGGTTGGGGGTMGGGGGTTGGGGGTTGGGGGTTGGGGGTTGGGGGATGGGGGTPDTAAQLTAIRAAADQGTTTGAFPVQGALVTYVRPLAPDAGATDPAGFFVQAGNTGPALFVSVLASSLPVSVGDRIDFTVTGLTRIGQLRVATAISGVTRQSGGNPVTGLAQNINSADFTQASVLDGYESELVTVSGTLATDFSFAGGGFQSAGLVTTGNLDAGVLRLRVTNELAASQGLGAGCSVQVSATPLWRYNAQAQPSAFTPTELGGSTCPTPVLQSAVAVNATSVRATFNRPMNPSTLTPASMTISGLAVSAVTGSGTTWTLTTSAQTGGQAYTLVAATSVADVRGTAISSTGRSAGFTGFQAPVGGLVINEVDYDNPGSDTVEFIELYNSGASSVTFGGETIALQSQSDATPYRTITLPSGTTVPPGGYFLIAPATVAPSYTGPRMDLATAGFIQNGPADGVALLSSTGAVLDSLSYAGDANLYGTQLLREGTGATTALVDSTSLNTSIGRIPNGSDSNSNATDFTVNSAPTPGAANQP